MPFLSIIIPVYNAEKYLEDCFAGIRRQTFTDYEVVIIDDGSKDGSPQMCDRYAAEDDRVKVFHVPNGGPSKARNTGFKAAAGEYIYCMDHDDCIEDDSFFQTVFESLSRNPVEVLQTGAKYLKEGESAPRKILELPAIPECDIFFPAKTIRCLVQAGKYETSCWTKFIKRNFLLGNELFFNESLTVEDLDWNMRFLPRLCSYNTLPSTAYVHYFRQESVSTAKGAKNLKNCQDQISVIRHYSESLMNNDCCKDLRDALLPYLVYQYYITLGRYGTLEEHYQRLIYTDLKNLRPVMKYARGKRQYLVFLFYRLFGFRALLWLMKVYFQKMSSGAGKRTEKGRGKPGLNKGLLIVSLDFELFWGMLDVCPLEKYRRNVLGVWDAVPRLLDIFSQYHVHATWAAVGFLFADSLEKIGRYSPSAEFLPGYRNGEKSSYRFMKDHARKIADNLKCFFAPELIEVISRCPGQEIGCHTFSHYYCLEAGQNADQFEADIRSALAIAKDHGYDLKTMVLPRNQCNREYIARLHKAGFVAYRARETDWIHRYLGKNLFKRMIRLLDVYFPLSGHDTYLPRKEDGVWKLTGSRMYKPFFAPLAFLERWKIRRIKNQMRYAAKHHTVFHLWWHPHNIGIRTEYHLKCLDEIFACYRSLCDRYGMQSMNMAEAAEYFSARDAK